MKYLSVLIEKVDNGFVVKKYYDDEVIAAEVHPDLEKIFKVLDFFFITGDPPELDEEDESETELPSDVLFSE